MAAVARHGGDSPESGGHRLHSAGPPSGTRSRAPPVPVTPPPDAARPGYEGGLQSQATAARNAGSPVGGPPPPRPPARPAARGGLASPRTGPRRRSTRRPRSVGVWSSGRDGSAAAGRTGDTPPRMP